VGEPISIQVETDRNAYVYLFDLDSAGRVTQLLPNAYETDNFLLANLPVEVPAAGSPYRFTVSRPEGVSRIFALASTQPLVTERLARFLAGSSFATSDLGIAGLQAAMPLVLSGVPQRDWVTAVVPYLVGEGRSSPTGESELRIDSQPDGAEVFLDGAFQGTTPLRLVAASGRRTLEIRLAGYAPYVTTLDLQAGGTQTVDVNLNRSAGLGTLYVESDPVGATVFLDGRYIGVTPLTERNLPEGRYRIEVERQGYTSVSRTVNINSGRSSLLSVTLLPELGRLVILGDVPGTQVFVDGRLVATLARTPAQLDAGSLEAGEVEVTLVAPGYGTVVQRVTIRVGRTETLVLQQTPR